MEPHGRMGFALPMWVRTGRRVRARREPGFDGRWSPLTVPIPEPTRLFTIRDLGGWKHINDTMFDPEKGSVAKIEEDAGVSTAK